MKITRGQMHFIEAIVAILLIYSATNVVTAVIDPTPTLTTPEEKELQNEIETEMDVVLQQSAEDGSLQHSILDYNTEDNRYEKYRDYQSGEGVYTNYPNSTFGNRLLSFKQKYDNDPRVGNRNVNMNIDIIPAENASNQGSQTRREEMQFLTTGEASQNSIVVTRRVALHGNDTLGGSKNNYQTDEYTPNKDLSGDKLHYSDSEIGEFTKNAVPRHKSSISNTDTYNVVTVRVVVWF